MNGINSVLKDLTAGASINVKGSYKGKIII